MEQEPGIKLCCFTLPKRVVVVVVFVTIKLNLTEIKFILLRVLEVTSLKWVSRG